MKREREEIALLLASESRCLARLEAILRAQEQGLDSRAPAQAAPEAERTALLAELAELRSAVASGLPGASRDEQRLSRENRERAHALLGRTRELIGRYGTERDELGAALSATRRARGLLAELGAQRRGGGRLDLKR